MVLTEALVSQHLARLRIAGTKAPTRSTLARWIAENTYLGGRRFSFKGHEYQRRIVESTAISRVIRKCSQVGVSEILIREVLALIQTTPGGLKAAYVFPSAGFAAKYSQARIDPVIASSPALSQAVDKADIERRDVKTFGSADKILHLKGATGATAAISDPLDAIYFDEYSFMDQTTAGDYQSRLTHSPLKWTTRFSTPTVPHDPICAAFDASRRHFLFARCNHCNHQFIPDYYEHVHLPGWSESLAEITQESLKSVDPAKAVLLCPNCGRPPDLSPAYREWVVENEAEDYPTEGFQVSPFDAPSFITPGDLIVASTRYRTKAKFQQFSLGKPDEDKTNGLSLEEVDTFGAFMPQPPPGPRFIGFDQGTTCHVVVGALGTDGILRAFHFERVSLGKFPERLAQLRAEYSTGDGSVGLMVGDSQPNISLALQLLALHRGFFPAAFTLHTGLATCSVGKTDTLQRVVDVNRTVALDRLLLDLREGRILLAKGPEWDLLTRHLTSLKRIEEPAKDGTLQAKWVKTNGEDHYHFALLYLTIAVAIRALTPRALPLSSFKMSTFRVKVEV